MILAKISHAAGLTCLAYELDFGLKAKQKLANVVYSLQSLLQKNWQ